jgi:hypothetical protein
MIMIINYDRKLCSKLNHNLQSQIYDRKTFMVQATGANPKKLFVEFFLPFSKLDRFSAWRNNERV